MSMARAAVAGDNSIAAEQLLWLAYQIGGPAVFLKADYKLSKAKLT
jgi:hypothetical protein